MKRRFNEEQIIGILKEHEAGISAKDLCRKHGMSDASFYKWKDKFGGMEVSDARRLRELELENVATKNKLSINRCEELPQKGDTLEFAGGTKEKIDYPTVQYRSSVLVLMMASMLATLSGGAYYFFKPSISTKVKKIMFCDPANFSEENDVCEKLFVNFPVGTKMILVSFRIDGAEDGHKFQRRWYRNGEKSKEKHDFYDDAWPGYTFIHNESGHDLGEYTLHVIVDGITYTGRFTVGEIEAKSANIPTVKNIRICDKFRFTQDIKSVTNTLPYFSMGSMT